jgi:hypothetical protein
MPNDKLLNDVLSATDKAIKKLKELGEGCGCGHGFNVVTKAPGDVPDFKPNKNLGEGEAPENEIKYRQTLLDLLNQLYDDTKDLKSVNDLDEIDDLINQFITDCNQLIDDSITSQWNNGVKEGLSELKGINNKKKFNTDNIDTTKKALIIQQQQCNIEDIAFKLRGKLRQSIMITAIKQPYKQTSTKTDNVTKAKYPSTWTQCMIQLFKKNPKLTEDELYFECERTTAFNDAQQNTDKLGLYGFITAHEEAMLGTLIAGSTIIGDMVADWVSVGDDNVCDECLEREANGPYSIFDNIWNDTHFGCRCWMENIRLPSSDKIFRKA